MIAESYLKLLVCPENRTPLHLADASLIDKLNAAVGQKQLKNKVDRVLETPLEGALVRADSMVAYPIIDNIPMLLVDEGILLEQVR